MNSDMFLGNNKKTSDRTMLFLCEWIFTASALVYVQFVVISSNPHNALLSDNQGREFCPWISQSPSQQNKIWTTKDCLGDCNNASSFPSRRDKECHCCSQGRENCSQRRENYNYGQHDVCRSQIVVESKSCNVEHLCHRSDIIMDSGSSSCFKRKTNPSDKTLLEDDSHSEQLPHFSDTDDISRIAHSETIPLHDTISGISLDIYLGLDAFVEFCESDPQLNNGLTIEVEEVTTKGDHSTVSAYDVNYRVTSPGPQLASIIVSVHRQGEESQTNVSGTSKFFGFLEISGFALAVVIIGVVFLLITTTFRDVFAQVTSTISAYWIYLMPGEDTLKVKGAVGVSFQWSYTQILAGYLSDWTRPLASIQRLREKLIPRTNWRQSTPVFSHNQECGGTEPLESDSQNCLKSSAPSYPLQEKSHSPSKTEIFRSKSSKPRKGNSKDLTEYSAETQVSSPTVGGLSLPERKKPRPRITIYKRQSDEVSEEKESLVRDHVTSDSLFGQGASSPVDMETMSDARMEQERVITRVTSAGIDAKCGNICKTCMVPSLVAFKLSGPRLRLFASLTFGTLLIVTIAAGLSRMRAKPTVHVVFPSSTTVRKVRMFTDYPDLALLSKKHTSLSLVSRLQLLDAKQCHDNPTNCKVSVACDSATAQSVNCRCRTGYYLKDWRCLACSTHCPTGHFLASPCSDHKDAECKPCTVCGLTQYAAAACNTHRDTICIDVSFPVGILPFNRSNLRDDGSEISVSHSLNVFLERLIDMQRLDTPMYVTNNQQILDFVWERPSGMDISVSVTGVYLIPTYHDLDVVDDTVLFQRLIDPSKTSKEYYTYVQNNFCRHPVPDYYSLQLEIIADRAASARVYRCDSQDSSTPACPSQFKDGDRYLKWDINEPCVKYSPQKLTALKDGYNSVVCTEETEILRKMFKKIRPTTLEWMFPSPDCEKDRRQCQECVSMSQCPKTNKTALFGNDGQCCGIPCFSTAPCQKAYSTACPPPQVECAKGDVNLFSLFPIFNSMDREFSCHLKYAPPKFLYNVSYSIHIPSIDYNSTEKHFFVEAKSRRQHKRKMSKFDFITILHDTRIPIEKEIMLLGDHIELSPYLHSLMKPFTIRQLKTHAQLATRKKFVKDLRGNTTYVQFERPFLYSSMTWYRDGCMKNVSQIFPNQTLYGDNFIPVEAKQGLQRPSFQSDPSNHPGYTYQLYRRKTQPLIKFVTRKGTSVLRHLQGRDVKGNLIPNSLYGRVTWHYETETWKLVFSGTQDLCPTVISIKIFTQLMTGCAGHFDLLINCPQDFTVTFNFTTSMSDLPDIFVLQVNDSVTSHHMVLSSMYAPVYMDENSSKNQAEVERQLSTADDQRKNFTALWQPIFFIIGFSFITFFFIIIIYHYVNTKAKLPDPSATDATPEPETVALNNRGEKQNHAMPAASPETPRARFSIYLFAALYIIYSIIFTFSLTFAVVYMAHSSFWGTTSSIESSESDLQMNVNKSIQDIKDHESNERSRLFSAFRERREACVRHLENENRKLLADYQRTTQQQMDAIFMENGTLHILSNKIQRQNVSAYMSQIAEFVSDCNKTIHSIVQRFEANYFDFLKKTAINQWLKVPQQIFLIQDGEDPNRKFLSSSQIKQFASWLEIDKVEELLAVGDNVAHRLSQVTTPTVPAVDVHFPSIVPHLASALPDIGAVPQEFTMSVVKADLSYNDSILSLDNEARALGSEPPDQARHTRSVDEAEFNFGFSGFMNRNLDHVASGEILDRGRRDGASSDEKIDEIGEKDKDLVNGIDGKLTYENNPRAHETFDSNIKIDGKVNQKDIASFLSDDPLLPSFESHSSSYPMRHSSASSLLSSSTDNANESTDNTYLYILIGVFLLLDTALFMYRLSWLMSQLYAAKHGYADRIPTDEACKQVLEIQTAYHLPAFDNSLDNSGGYYVDGKDQLYVTEHEREGEMTFLQSFPKTKDDILQKIFNEKISQAEERRLRSMRRCFLWRWCASLRAMVQRLFLSQLVWQTTVTLLAIVFLCIFVYCVEFWLTTENFRTLVGGQSATSDVQWQLDTSGRYLHSLAYQVTTELGRLRLLCDMEVNTLTDAFYTTVNMQTAAFTNSLQRLCMEAQEKNCDKYSAFKPAGGRIVGCNFLPVQAQVFQDLNLSSIESLVSGEVMPFLDMSRRVIATSSVVIILMLCFRLLCQAGATTVRHYLLLTGRLPRVKVYQTEEQCHALKHGAGPHSTAAMQRSQSWVDSCESGVYVGEVEEATANKEEIPKMV